MQRVRWEITTIEIREESIVKALSCDGVVVEVDNARKLMAMPTFVNGALKATRIRKKPKTQHQSVTQVSIWMTVLQTQTNAKAYCPAALQTNEQHEWSGILLWHCIAIRIWCLQSKEWSGIWFRIVVGIWFAVQ